MRHWNSNKHWSNERCIPNPKQWKRMFVWKRMLFNLCADGKKTGSKGYVDIQKELENSMEENFKQQGSF